MNSSSCVENSIQVLVSGGRGGGERSLYASYASAFLSLFGLFWRAAEYFVLVLPDVHTSFIVLETLTTCSWCQLQTMDSQLTSNIIFRMFSFP